MDQIEELYKHQINLTKSINAISATNLELQSQISTLIKGADSDREGNKHLLDSLSWLQAEINLLLAFILSEPDTMPRFALFAKAIAMNTTEDLKESAALAQALLNNMHLTKHLPVVQSQSSSFGKSHPEVLHHLGDNVIQFPKPPGNDSQA